MKILPAMLATLTLATTLLAEDSSRLVSNLKAGKKQTVVTYGTSLTAGGAWVKDLDNALQEKYPGLATVINSGQGYKWSTWGVENLDSRVISKKPDTVLIEFAMNDAFLDYNTSIEQARANLNTMIDRILAAKPDTEIILMTMNPPRGIHLSRRPKVADYYQMYRDVAKERKLMLIDNDANWEPISKDKALFLKYVPDMIHPSPEGSTKFTTPQILKSLGVQ
jgi:lysophospholipase L1-like esterase